MDVRCCLKWLHISPRCLDSFSSLEHLLTHLYLLMLLYFREHLCWPKWVRVLGQGPCWCFIGPLSYKEPLPKRSVASIKSGPSIRRMCWETPTAGSLNKHSRVRGTPRADQLNRQVDWTQLFWVSVTRKAFLGQDWFIRAGRFLNKWTYAHNTDETTHVLSKHCNFILVA